MICLSGKGRLERICSRIRCILFFSFAEDAFEETVCTCIRVDSVVAEHTPSERDAIIKDSQTIILQNLTESLLLDSTDQEAQRGRTRSDDE